MPLQDIIPPNTLLCNTAKGIYINYPFTFLIPKKAYNRIVHYATGLYLKDRKLQNEACRDALGREQPYAILSGE